MFVEKWSLAAACWVREPGGGKAMRRAMRRLTGVRDVGDRAAERQRRRDPLAPQQEGGTKLQAQWRASECVSVLMGRCVPYGEYL